MGSKVSISKGGSGGGGRLTNPSQRPKCREVCLIVAPSKNPIPGSAAINGGRTSPPAVQSAYWLRATLP